jgi:hypothetical protein
LNKNDEKGTVIDDQMSQGKTIRSIPLRKLPSQEDPDGEEEEDQDRQIGMEARSKKLTPQVEKEPQPNERADTEKDIKSFSPSDVFLPREV